jgi:hypothetical protein
VNPEETVNESISLHNLLEPINIRVLVDQIRNIDIFCPVTGYPGTDISLQTSRVIREEGKRSVKFRLYQRWEDWSEVYCMADKDS